MSTLERRTVWWTIAAALSCVSCGGAGTTPTLQSFEFRAEDNLALGTDARGLVKDGAVHVLVPADTNVTALAPRVTHDGASLSPSDGEPRDFTFPVTYTMRSASGDAATFKVVVFAGASFPAEIVDLRGPSSKKATIKGDAISVEVKAGTDLSAWKPTITFRGASLTPGSGVAQDFRTPVRYRVTAIDGTEHYYTATVTAK